VKSYVVEVAIRADVTWDQLGEAKRLARIRLIDEDLRRLADDRRTWTFVIEGPNIEDAMRLAVQQTADAFTEVDPEAEVVGLALTGDG